MMYGDARLLTPDNKRLAPSRRLAAQEIPGATVYSSMCCL